MKAKLKFMAKQCWIRYGFWLTVGPAVARMDGLARLLPSVISVVPAPAGSMPCGSKCLLARVSLVWMMVLPLSTTEGTFPRVSTDPRVRPTFSTLRPKGPSPFAASVEVRMTVLVVFCRMGPTLECTRLQGGLAGVAEVKVTALGGELAEDDEQADEEGVWIPTGFRGAPAASAITDLVSADSLASDMTYRVFMGLVAVTEVSEFAAAAPPAGAG